MKNFIKIGSSAVLGVLLAATFTTSASAATITWIQGGTFDSNAVLALAGTSANEAYGVDFGGSNSQTTANGYTFNDNSAGNFLLSSGSTQNQDTSSYNGYLDQGATTGDAGLDSVLQNGRYANAFTGPLGHAPVTGSLLNLTIGNTYTVLVLEDDTRDNPAITGRQVNANDSTLTQTYAFDADSPATGGYLLGTFVADASTQALTLHITSSDPTEVQYNGILLENGAVVPEPGTYALLLGGLGLLVFISRLRVRSV